ncbi:MAG TPA: hypothetical protein VMU09_04810 [Acidimicrobiales bacterium]|nr:hypothetical protein [Acidimicrobiales bacterium]
MQTDLLASGAALGFVGAVVSAAAALIRRLELRARRADERV